jgi:hypothetical protein
MFIESHGDTISAGFIPIALEIANTVTSDDITPRSWGSALLAGIYRVMRQFNLLQDIVPPPADKPLLAEIHE